METQLAGDAELKLRQALARYRDWRGVPVNGAAPVPVRVLGDGSNNLSVLVEADRRYVVRINRRQAAGNALDATAEVAALSQAAQAGLAPALRFADTEAGIVVCDYLPPDSSTPVQAGELARLLRAIHRLPPIAARLSLPGRIRHYERAVQGRAGSRGRAQMDALAQAAGSSARELEAADPVPVLCHNDLLPANRIRSGGRLWALDWEYAAMGSRWFDLAVVCAGDDLGPEAGAALAGRYLGRPPAAHELRLLQCARLSYGYLELLWYLANAAGYDPEPALARLRSLVGVRP